jgi:hypothetical protein
MCLVLLAMYFATLGLIGPPPNLSVNIPVPTSLQAIGLQALLSLPFGVVGICALYGYLRASQPWESRLWCATLIALAFMVVVEVVEFLRPESTAPLRLPSTVLGYLLALFVISAGLLRVSWLRRKPKLTKHD